MSEPKRVAIIAVHGLGGPPPGRPAGRVAEALLHTERFHSEPTRREDLVIRADFDDDESYPANLYHTVRFSTGVTLDAADPGKSAEAGATVPERHDVDVYEVYWADLSRAGTSLQRLPLDVLELAFFPLHLAEQAFAAERTTRPDDAWLRASHRLFRLSAVILAGVLPPLFLFLLMRMVILALTTLESRTQEIVGRILAGVVAFAGLSLVALAGRWAVSRLTASGPRARWAPWLYLALAVTVVSLGALAAGIPEAARFARLLGHPASIVVCAELASWAIFFFLAHRLGYLLHESWSPRRANGKRVHYLVGWWKHAVAILAILDYGGHLACDSHLFDGRPKLVEPTVTGFQLARLETFDIAWVAAYALLSVAWVAAVLAAGAGFLTGRRPARAGRFTTVGPPLWVLLSVTAFIVVTSVLYLGLWSQLYLTLMLPQHDVVDAYWRIGWWLDASSSNVWVVACLVAGALGCLLPAFTSLWLMLAGGNRAVNLRPGYATESGSAGAASPRMEYRMLNAALLVLPWAVSLMFVGVTLVVLVTTAVEVFDVGLEDKPLSNAQLKTDSLTEIARGVSGVSGVVLLLILRAALTSRGGGTVDGFKSMIDLVFDLLNYQRGNTRVYGDDVALLGPGRRTSAMADKVYDRYEAVLNTIRDGRYDAVMIAAHSQGSAITFDLLTRPDPHPNPWPKIWMLVTFGCPVRQLYGAVFPSQYDRDSLEKWCFNTSPMPGRWWNIFFGTDCVGRNLKPGSVDPATGDYVAWNARTAGATANLPIECAPGALRHDGREGILENCIGVGGHTAYWRNRELLGRVIRQCIAVMLPPTADPAPAAAPVADLASAA